MHKQAIKHKQAIIGGGYLFTENACFKVVTASIHLVCKVSRRCYRGFLCDHSKQYVHFEPGCKAEEMAVRQTALPVLRSREVLVKNFATTINRADTLQVRVGAAADFCSIWSNN